MKTLWLLVEIPWFIFVITVIGTLFAILGVLGTFYDFAAALVTGRGLRYFLWQLGVVKSCPHCGGELMQHGYEPDARYTCHTEGCKFNED